MRRRHALIAALAAAARITPVAVVRTEAELMAAIARGGRVLVLNTIQLKGSL